MKRLSAFLNEEFIQGLRQECLNKTFPGISFEHAMQFFLTDGMIPARNLPTQSFLKLEDWARHHNEDKKALSYTATELKNKTGEILDKVLQGDKIRIVKHGRPIAEIRRVS